jgi:hypothetical protein
MYGAKIRKGIGIGVLRTLLWRVAVVTERSRRNDGFIFREVDWKWSGREAR